jgi:hypothetical protein
MPALPALSAASDFARSRQRAQAFDSPAAKPIPFGGCLATPSLAHIAEIVDATDLPVNADFQSGYAHEPERLAENVG